MKSIETDISLNSNEIRNFSIEKLAADPTGGDLYQGRRWFNTTSNKHKYYDGAAVLVLASEKWVLDQIQMLGMVQGSFDASPGALPTPAALADGDTVIRRGDYWVISVGGNINGLQGSGALSVGDILQFTGTDPTKAAQWVGIQRNIDDSLIGNTRPERQTINLVANTPLTVAATSIADVYAIQCYNSAGDEIILDIKKGANPNQRILTAKRSLTGVVVELLGATSV